MKLRSVWVRVAVLTGLALAAALGTLVIWRSLRAMRSAAADVRAESEFRFVARALPAPRNPGFEVVSAPAVYLQGARFQDHLYLAGPAGLQEYSREGALLHQYSVGNELPASPLVGLARSSRPAARFATRCTKPLIPISSPVNIEYFPHQRFLLWTDVKPFDCWRRGQPSNWLHAAFWPRCGKLASCSMPPRFPAL